jgi:hypothetical protein
VMGNKKASIVSFCARQFKFKTAGFSFLPLFETALFFYYYPHSRLWSMIKTRLHVTSDKGEIVIEVRLKGQA